MSESVYKYYFTLKLPPSKLPLLSVENALANDAQAVVAATIRMPCQLILVRDVSVDRYANTAAITADTVAPAMSFSLMVNNDEFIKKYSFNVNNYGVIPYFFSSTGDNTFFQFGSDALQLACSCPSFTALQNSKVHVEGSNAISSVISA